MHKSVLEVEECTGCPEVFPSWRFRQLGGWRAAGAAVGTAGIFFVGDKIVLGECGKEFCKREAFRGEGRAAIARSAQWKMKLCDLSDEKLIDDLCKRIGAAVKNGCASTAYIADVEHPELPSTDMPTAGQGGDGQNFSHG